MSLLLNPVSIFLKSDSYFLTHELITFVLYGDKKSILSFSNTLLAYILLVSILARRALGAKQGILCCSKRSTKPNSIYFSGPIMAN